MCDSISSAMAAQTLSIQMACQQMAFQKTQGAIVLQLLEGATQAVSNAPQDPSTVTAAQLKHPIDLRV